eukprot:12020170-Ditylum_brightwellii.AAC.1
MQQSIIVHVSQVKTDLGTEFTTHVNDMNDHLKEIRPFINNLPPLRFTQPSSGTSPNTNSSTPAGTGATTGHNTTTPAPSPSIPAPAPVPSSQHTGTSYATGTATYTMAGAGTTGPTAIVIDDDKPLKI